AACSVLPARCAGCRRDPVWLFEWRPDHKPWEQVRGRRAARLRLQRAARRAKSETERLLHLQYIVVPRPTRTNYCGVILWDDGGWGKTKISCTAARMARRTLGRSEMPGRREVRAETVVNRFLKAQSGQAPVRTRPDRHSVLAQNAANRRPLPDRSCGGPLRRGVPARRTTDRPPASPYRDRPSIGS